ncbi:MAG: hypothetical protein Kow0047_08740 [Anaerolineae bacterium]
MTRSRRGTIDTLWLIVGVFLIIAGYWGPWVVHASPALTLIGLDLAEYVKFLPEFRSGQLRLWREGFYLPLFATSLTLSLVASRRELRIPRVARGAVWLSALPIALSMLPPAWSPPILWAPEFRPQTIAIVASLAAMALFPAWRRLPAGVVSVGLIGLHLAAAVIPTWHFAMMRPAIDLVYARPVSLGWGLPVMIAGQATVVAVMASWGLRPRLSAVRRPG